MQQVWCFSISAGHDVPNGVNDQDNGQVNGNTNGVTDQTNGVNGHADSSSKPSLRLTFPEYRRISNLLVLHLRRAEEGKTPKTHTFYTFYMC